MLKHFLIIFLTIPFWCRSQDSANSIVQKILKELESRQKALTGQPFPSFKMQVNGKTFSNSELINKVSLVNFWFAGCKPCLLEFDGLNKLNEKLRGSEDFQLIAFTYEKQEIINEIRKKYSLNFRTISVSYEEFERLLQGFGCPVNVIVNKEGIVKYWKSGGETSKEKVDDFIWKIMYPVIAEEL